MNAKTLFSAFALVAFLSCQNQPDAPSAPQAETGTLALRVVSSKALAQVDFVTVSLSWGSDMKVERTSPWDAPSIKLDGLPLGVRLSVHMEGWNDERGRKVVVWSGDAYAQLTGDTNWDMNNEAPIVIVSAAPAASPNLATLLPAGYAFAGDSLRLWLGAGKADTIRLGGSGVDSVLLDDKNLAPVDGKFPIVLVPGDQHQVVVVGTNGMITTFRVSAAAKLPSARELVVPNTARSWSNDTLSFSLPDGASDTIRIGTSGVDSLWVNGSKVLPEGGIYRVIVKAPSRDSIVVKGAAGQSVKFTVVVGAIPKAQVTPGLVADFKLAPPSWVGAICSLRVAMDSGKVDSVVMLEPDRIAFTKVNDSLWKLDWATKGTSDSLKVRVYGQGSKGTDSVNLVRYVSFDRDAPTIRVANRPTTGFLFGKSGGVVSWKAIDRGLATTWATDTGDAKVTCSGDTCLATGVKKSFVIHAKDELGNDTSVNVTVSIDDAGPSFVSVKDAAGNGLGKGDTLWIDSAVGSGTVVVAANDVLSGMVIVAERAAPPGAIQERIASGSATISGLTVGTWTMRATDDLGNGTPWGSIVVATGAGVAVRIRPPVINKPAGTYGAGDTKYVKFVEWVDALPIAMTCPDGGTAYAKPHEDTASVAWQKAWTNLFGTETYDIRCIKGAEATDTSEIVSRTYNVLQRPWIKQNDTTFTGSSLIVEIARGSGVKSNPAQAEIQYCLGDSLTCVAATWSTYSAPVVISTSTTLWARVAYEGKYSHAAKRTYTKTEKNLAWGLDFSQAAYDTASIRTNYGGVVWSFQTIDTIKANIANGHMSINAIWLMEGRLENQWGLGGITIPLDKEWGTYDFSKVDSITFDYKTSGTLNGLYFYPVHKDDDGSAEGPQYFVLPSVGGDLNHVIFKTTDIATPQWGAGLVTWPAIQNAIEAIRFGVAPETATTGKGFPAGPSGAVMIDNVRIYGIITKN